MGRWLTGILTTLIVLALTSLVGGLLKGPIDELASSDRLSAQVQLAPWTPRPETGTASAERKVNNKTLEQELDDILSKQDSRISLSSASTFQFARVIITNDSSNPVTNISLRLNGSTEARVSVVVDENDKQTVTWKSNRIKVPDMNPGDRVGVFIWTSYFSSYDIEQTLKTYSSSGRFRTTFDWPEYQSYEYGSDLGQFLEDWAWPTFITVMGLLGFILVIMLAVHDTYHKALLNNERFYYKEKEGFDNLGSKFKPDFEGAEKVKKIST